MCFCINFIEVKVNFTCCRKANKQTFLGDTAILFGLVGGVRLRVCESKTARVENAERLVSKCFLSWHSRCVVHWLLGWFGE